jgi:hypothetical protein
MATSNNDEGRLAKPTLRQIVGRLDADDCKQGVRPED